MKQKILFVLSLLLGLVFINAGLDKFLHYMPMPKDLPEKVVKMGTAFNEIGWVMPLVGFAELLGGLLLIIPKTRALGAVILFPVMIGILLTHILVAPSGLPLAMIIFAILLGIIFDNRKKYLPMIQ